MEEIREQQIARQAIKEMRSSHSRIEEKIKDAETRISPPLKENDLWEIYLEAGQVAARARGALDLIDQVRRNKA